MTVLVLKVGVVKKNRTNILTQVGARCVDPMVNTIEPHQRVRPVL